MTCIGIDLGTTNSLIAVYEDSGPRLLPNALGEYLTPSVVGLADDKKTVLVGKSAQARLIRYPELTRAVFKRHMGSGTTFRLGKMQFNAVDLSAMVLSSLKKDAEASLRTSITDAVISVPAYFNSVQRQATKDAAEIAGLKVRRLINEPTAAALATGVLDREAERTFIVLDLGGGTFDVSILEMFDGVMEVRASAGDSFLGGEDFSGVVARHFAEQMGLGWDDATAAEKEKLVAFSEKIKRALTFENEVKGELSLTGKTKELSLTTQRFEELSATLLGRMRRPIEKCIYDSGLDTAEIDRVILVGGATRMPAIRSLTARVFKKIPDRSIDPDHAIALGAAVQAGLIENHRALKDIVLTDVAPFSLGIETTKTHGKNIIHNAFAPIIERNTILPASRRQYFTTTRDNQEEIRVAIYQGESAHARDNIGLGSFHVPIPRALAGEEAIEVRFTYDVSGLLAVDVSILSTGELVSQVVDNLAQAMSSSEKAQRLKDMEQFKVNPRDEEENIALMETINHMHELLLGEDREYVMGLLGRFEAALDSQDPSRIESERSEIADIMRRIEAGYVS